MTQALTRPALAVVLAALAGAGVDPAEKLPRSESHLRYLPLEGEEARRLLDQALAFGRKRLGEPALPVRKVELRRSVPREEGSPLPRGFRLTEIADPAAGVFVIYLSALPGEAAFPGQLAHEAFHLFNARLRDAYVEGLNTLLAEELLRELGLPWEPWERHFREGGDPYYGEAYFLMRELAEAVGREKLHTLLGFAVESKEDRRRMEIDIDRWLGSLPAEPRARARALIARRWEALEALRKREDPEAALRRPQDR